MRRWRWIVAAVAVLAAVAVGAWLLLRPPAVVRALPPGDGFAYLNFVPLRKSGLLALGGAVAKAPEYAAFVRDSGFQFERDLDAVALSLRGPLADPASSTAVLEGNFSARFLGYLRAHATATVPIGDLTSYTFPGWARPQQTITVVPLDARRILVTNAPSPMLTSGDVSWPLMFPRPLGYAAAHDGGLDALVPGLRSLSLRLRPGSGGSLHAHAELEAASPADAARILNEIQQQTKAVTWLNPLQATLDGNHLALDVNLSAADLAALTGASSGKG